MQSFNLNLVPGSFQQVFNCSQGDIGRQLTAKLFDGSTEYAIPAGSTVKIKATKPSGFGFDESATFSGSTVTITTVETMTNEWGRFPAELVITKDGNVIGTANFLFNIEKNPHPDSTVDGDAEEVIPELTLLVERVEAAASSVLDMEVVATTLPAGSQASYSYDEDLNKATFGIPQGEAGAGAAGVVASAYSSSKTYKVGDYVLHNSNLYRCITAITTAEAFTAAHWTQIVLADDVSDLKSDLDEYKKDFFEEVPTIWRKALKSAVGADATGNGMCSLIVENVDYILMTPKAKTAILLYRYGNYVGKINANGGCDQVAGSWKMFYGLVNIKATMDSFGANGFVFAGQPNDGTTLTDETVQTFSEANVTFLRKKNEDITKTAGLTYERGTIFADGVFHKSNPWYPDIYYNIVVSDFMKNVHSILLSGNVSSGLFFYNGGEFVGKVSANGSINKTSGDWGNFYNYIDVLDVMAKNNIVADSIRFTVEAKDGTTITDDSAQTYGEAHAIVLQSMYASGSDIADLDAYIKDSFFMTLNHRGFSAIAPENTLPAFALSKKNGFKWVEGDLDWTSDNVPVILHDPTINRTARNLDGSAISSTINIADITYEEALDYDFGIWKNPIYAGTKIPTLQQYLLLCKQLSLNCAIDIKTQLTSAQIEIIEKAVKAVGMGENVAFLSSYWNNLDALGDLFPKALLDYGILVYSATDEQVQTAVTVCTSLKTDINKVTFSIYHTALTQTQYDTLTDAGINILVWKDSGDFTKSEVLAFNKAVVGAFCDGIEAGEIIMENALSQY